MSANVSYCPTWVLDGLQTNDPLPLKFYYNYIKPKAIAVIRRLYPDDPHDWLKDSFSMAFLKFLEKIQSGSYVHDNLDAFAIQIIRYTYSNLRRNRLAKAKVTDQIPDQLMATPETTNTPENLGELFEFIKRKRHARWYRNLRPEQKSMLDLRMRGWHYKDIADELGVAHGTIRNKFPKLLAQAQKL